MLAVKNTLKSEFAGAWLCKIRLKREPVHELINKMLNVITSKWKKFSICELEYFSNKGLCDFLSISINKMILLVHGVVLILSYEFLTVRGQLDSNYYQNSLWMSKLKSFFWHLWYWNILEILDTWTNL